MNHWMLLALFSISLTLSFDTATAQSDTHFVPPQREPITANSAAQLERFGTVGGGWWLRDVDWSPDGNLIAVASMGGVLLYDADDLYAVPRILDGHTQEVTGASFSPDGQHLASVSHDQTIKIWDIDSGRITAAWEHDKKWTYNVAYSTNGQRMAIDTYSPPNESADLLFDSATGSLIETFEDSLIEFDSQNVFLYEDGAVVRKNVETGTTQTILELPEEPNQIVFSPDQRYLATTRDVDLLYEHSIQIWEVATGELVVTLPFTGTMNLSWSPDGNSLVTFSWRYGPKYLWNVNMLLTGNIEEAQQELAGPFLPISGAAFSPDSSRLAMVGWDDNHSQLESSLWVWDLDNDQPSATVLRSASTGAPQLNGDASLLHYQGSIWDLRAGRELYVTNETIRQVTDDFTKAISFAEAQFDSESVSRGRSCYFEDQNCISTRHVWDVATGSLLETQRIDQRDRQTQGETLQANIIENNVQLRLPEADTVLHTLSHDRPVWHTTFSPNQQKLITRSHQSGEDVELITFWDVATGEKLNEIEVDRLQSRYVFSPDESLLFIWSKRTVYVWNTTTGTEQYRFSGPEPNLVWDLEFRQGGEIFAVGWGDWDNFVELRDTLTGEVIDTLDGFPSFITSMIFSPDEKILALSSSNQVWLWNLSESDVQVIENDTPFVLYDIYDSLQLTPDSSILFLEYGYPEAFTDVWDIETQSLIATLEGDNLQATENWDLLITEAKGLVHLWGIPDDTR